MTILNSITEDGLRRIMAENGTDYEVGVVPTPHPFACDAETGYFTSYRKDEPNGKPFAQGLSGRFEPIQNFDAFRCLVGLSGATGAKLENMRAIRGGAEVIAQISLGEIEVGGRGDKVGKYLSLVNAHDGTSSLLNMITPRRFWCDNQINGAITMARRDQKRGSNVLIRIQHSASAHDKIERLISSVRVAEGEFRKDEELYNRLYDTKFDESYVWDVLKHLFPLKPDATDRSRVIWTNRMSDIAARFESADNGRTPKDTAWNLYNSIQGNLQHYGGSEESRFKSALNGSVMAKSSDAMAAVLDITSSENISEALKGEIEEMLA